MRGEIAFSLVFFMTACLSAQANPWYESSTFSNAKLVSYEERTLPSKADSMLRLVGDEEEALNDRILHLNAKSVAAGEAGQFDDGIRYAREAYALARENLGDEHEDTIRSLQNLASLHIAADKFDDAHSILSELLRIRRGTYGDEHPESVTSLLLLGVNYLMLERFEDAELPFFQSTAH